MRRKRVKGLPANWGWMLALGIVGAVIYTSDFFGIRTKAIEPIVMKAKSTAGGV